MRGTGFLALAVALALASSGCTELNTELVIKADGGCEVRQETVSLRAVLEGQLRFMELYEAGPFPLGEEGVPTVDGEATEEQAGLTDEELEEKLKEMVEEQVTAFGLGQMEVKEIEFEGDRVRLATQASFEGLRDLLAGPQVFQQTGFSRIVADADEQGRFRLTFSAEKGERRFRKEMAGQIKATGFRGSFRIVLPGEVIESSLPHKEGTATWIEIDPDEPETLDALEEIYKSGSVRIVSEMGALEVELPLDSRELALPFGEKTPALPITDAAPGFAAEADSVTTTTIHYFPGAPREFREEDHEADDVGVKISAKLYPPRGRRILSVSAARALSAVDDRGREIEPAGRNESIAGLVSRSGREGDEKAASIELRLQVPEPDAEAIEELEGEAVVVTFGRWKEHRVEDVRADPKTAIDLSDVLPDTKMIVGKIKEGEREAQEEFRWREGQVFLKVRGPDEIGQLRFAVEMAGVEDVSSHNRRDSTKTKDGRKIRSVAVQYSTFAHDGAPATGPLVLVVRYPDEMRRERVRFTLEGLDLF